MKNLLFIIFIISSQFTFGQKVQVKKPTKLETQNWIIEKMRSYGYSEGTTSNHYSIEFVGTTIEIRNRLVHELGNLNSLDVFNIADIDYIYFSENNEIFGFKIKLKPGKIKTTYYNGELQKSNDVFEFELNMSFKENNLPERTKKAFSRLVELYGGKPIIVKEAY